MSIDQIRELRTRTNVSLGECKKAFDDSSGDLDKAFELLQKRGLLKAADRANRVGTQGCIFTYSHGNGSKVALVEVNCETDFAARAPQFVEFCEQVALQIVGIGPLYVRREEIPEELVTKTTEIFLAQVPADKPEAARAKILEGKLNKWKSEICLLEQESIVVPKKTVDQLRLELIAKIGENVTVRRFVRWEVGEGLEVAPVADYAAEIAKMSGVS